VQTAWCVTSHGSFSVTAENALMHGGNAMDTETALTLATNSTAVTTAPAYSFMLE